MVFLVDNPPYMTPNQWALAQNEGTETDCVERDDSRLERVDNYVRFFTALRPMNRLLVAGIWTLPRLDAGGELVVTRRGGARGECLDRGEGNDAGCVHRNDANCTGAAVAGVWRKVPQAPDKITSFRCAQ